MHAYEEQVKKQHKQNSWPSFLQDKFDYSKRFHIY
jgi:hypothetical protein